MEFGVRQVEALGNTPGIWYALSYFMGTLVFLSSNRKKQTGWKKYLSILAIGAAMVAVMSLTNGVSGVPFFFIMLLIFMGIWLIIYFNMKVSTKADLYFALRAFMLGEFTASFGWQIYFYAVGHFGLGVGILRQTCVILPVITIIGVISFFLEKRHSKNNRDMEFNTQRVGGALLIVLLIYAFSNLSYVAAGTPFTTVYPAELFIIRTSSDLMGVILLYMYHELLQQTSKAIEESTLRNLLEMQYSQFQVSEESVAMVNQKYHDLKHQIAMLKTSLKEDSDKPTEYLDQMLDEIRQYEAQFKTGNSVLDTMLSAEAMKCQTRGIELTVVADGSCLSFMNPMDISAIFGNALDNAIESAEQIPDPNERLIHMSVTRQKSFLRIQVENRYTGKVKFHHHLPITTKTDKNLHGFGVKSMKQIAEKYGGSMRAEGDEEWFKLFILIPIPADAVTE